MINKIYCFTCFFIPIFECVLFFCLHFIAQILDPYISLQFNITMTVYVWFIFHKTESWDAVLDRCKAVHGAAYRPRACRSACLSWLLERRNSFIWAFICVLPYLHQMQHVYCQHVGLCLLWPWSYFGQLWGFFLACREGPRSDSGS